MVIRKTFNQEPSEIQIPATSKGMNKLTVTIIYNNNVFLTQSGTSKSNISHDLAKAVDKTNH